VFSNPEVPQGPAANVAGIWKVRMKYQCGEGSQRFLLEQQESAITGVHQGEIYSGNLSGKVHAEQVSFRSFMPVGGNAIEYAFSGTATGNSMSGTVALGEYGHATWSATRET
jgi:D-glucosaminate-6-phosphate ammonia-lyase